MINKLAVVAVLLWISGCASSPQRDPHPADPWEGYNRAVFKFNDTLDRAVFKPVTRGYQKAAPDMVETGVSNFFSNLSDVGNSVNNLLQGEPGKAGSDLARFTLNSTFGLAGIIDVASSAGFEKHSEDFGQTLAVWGVPSGPYFMLPFLGPSTIRDTGGYAVDLFTHYPWRYLDDETIRYSLTAMNFIDLRSEILKLEDLLGTQFFDPYASIRDAWLEYRVSQIANGAHSISQDDDELIEDLEALERL
jgi:phospholipid-binding lipoprotein MlaA